MNRNIRISRGMMQVQSKCHCEGQSINSFQGSRVLPRPPIPSLFTATLHQKVPHDTFASTCVVDPHYHQAAID